METQLKRKEYIRCGFESMIVWGSYFYKAMSNDQEQEPMKENKYENTFHLASIGEGV